MEATTDLPAPRTLGRLAAAATLPGARNGQKGHQSGPATKSSTTTLTALLTTTTNYYYAFMESTTDLPAPRTVGRLAAAATLFGPPGDRNGQKGSPEWSCY